jgi:hypothetical protein
MKENEDDIPSAASKLADDTLQAPAESGDDERFVSFDDFSPPVSIPEQINPDDEYPSEDNEDTLFETLFSEVNGEH